MQARGRVDNASLFGVVHLRVELFDDDEARTAHSADGAPDSAFDVERDLVDLELVVFGRPLTPEGRGRRMQVEVDGRITPPSDELLTKCSLRKLRGCSEREGLRDRPGRRPHPGVVVGGAVKEGALRLRGVRSG